ncbi:MAG: hypothetical protein K2K57_08515 [Oscillospiraceae bacterium]|nr:hypothetical protein [Oscillospiraceae bacterium]
MLEYTEFTEKMTQKAQGRTFEQNVDFIIALCLRDMRNYKYYIEAENRSIDIFAVCYETIAHILMNRDSLDRVQSEKYIALCNDFLENLQDEDGEYFDVCVNITCEIMHLLHYIAFKDSREAAEAAKLSYESAEAHYQDLGLDCESSEYAEKMSAFAQCLNDLDISGLTDFLNID